MILKETVKKIAKYPKEVLFILLKFLHTITDRINFEVRDMKKLYLVRHGQTLFNELHMTQGWCDSPLTELGKKQAKEAGRSLRNVDFSAVYTSTSERTSDTAELITDKPYTRLKAFKEIYFGLYEGQREFTQPKNWFVDNTDAFVPYGGESVQEMAERFENCVKAIMKREEGENILIVSHGCTIGTFLDRFAPDTMQLIRNQHGIPNCGIAVFEYESETENFVLENLVDPLRWGHKDDDVVKL